jgi:hypothetical protein
VGAHGVYFRARDHAPHSRQFPPVLWAPSLLELDYRVRNLVCTAQTRETVNREVQMKDTSVLADGRTVDEALRKGLSTFTDCSGDSIERVSKQTHPVCFVDGRTHYASSIMRPPDQKISSPPGSGLLPSGHSSKNERQHRHQWQV